MNATNTNITVVLQNVPLSFPNLYVPTQADATSKPRYSATLLIAKEDTENYNRVKAAIDKAAKAFWPKGVPKKTKYCLRDAGDHAEKYEGYVEGDFYVSAARAEKLGAPLCINGRKERVSHEEGSLKFYGGAIVNAKISIYAMEHKTGGPMVNAALEVVQFVRDGKPFGGSRPTADDMPDVAEEASEPLSEDSSLD